MIITTDDQREVGCQARSGGITVKAPRAAVLLAVQLSIVTFWEPNSWVISAFNCIEAADRFLILAVGVGMD